MAKKKLTKVAIASLRSRIQKLGREPSGKEVTDLARRYKVGVESIRYHGKKVYGATRKPIRRKPVRRKRRINSETVLIGVEKADVWVEFRNGKKGKARIAEIICSDLELAAERIREAIGNRE